MALVTGKRLGRYEIRSKIGAGGMGEVYLAEDLKLHRQVAIKFLPGDSAGSEQANLRLLREAQAAAKLDHPNICAVHEVSEEAGRTFIVMPYVEGETLAVRIKREPLDVSESLSIATQVADAVAEAHAHGIIHRDIKPSNIIITPRGQAKVMDFGLARFSAPRDAGVAGGPGIDTEASTQALLTSPGMIIGTVPYMSPEQVHGQPLDARTDIFSFGVVLYEMLTGRQPFAAESGAGTISAILTREPLPLTQHVDRCSEELERIVRKCLEKDRERRYQTMRDVPIDLDNCRREYEAARMVTSQKKSAGASKLVTATARRPKDGRSSFQRRGVIALVSLVLIAGATLAYKFIARRRATSASPPQIKSLAVLPLKSLDAGENYLGLGIADAVIRRISQTGGLIVRPTSAVRRYLNEDTDALTAGRQLGADVVLDGSIQRANDRLRVSVNLLRTTDGMSVGASYVDMQMTDVFTIEDAVAQQVATRLQLQLDQAQQARLTKRSTSNPIAYEFYMKAVYVFDLVLARSGPKDKPQSDATIDLLKKAIESDPNYALAHAQLAYVYANRALFIEPTNPLWAQRTREEIDRAQTLDPQLAEIHIARSLLLWSAYDGWQIEDAIRELRLAEQVDPNLGHANLGALYQHAGLEDLAARELQHALDIDPTSEFVKSMIVGMSEILRKYDDEFAAAQKFFGASRPDAEYLLAKGRLDEGQKRIEQLKATEPDNPDLPQLEALLFALRGDFRAAEAQFPAIFARVAHTDPNYHHATYNVACVYALEGKSAEAVKSLKETAATGFPCYPLFARDPYLNRVRQAPEFIQFIADMKTQNERLRREFADGAP